MAWRLLTVLVTIVSVAWVAVLLIDIMPDLESAISMLDPNLLAAGFGLSLLSAYLLFEVFAVLIRMAGIEPMPRRYLAHLHFTGQLLKHLPGRVWGVGYQWAAHDRTAMSFRGWILANAAHVLQATYFAVWGAALILTSNESIALSIMIGLAGAGGYWIVWLLASSRRLHRLVARCLPVRLGKTVQRSFELLAAAPSKTLAHMFLLSSGAWILYYMTWMLYGAAYPALGLESGATLGAYYMLAWLMGYLSLLTPSGVGVRELAFAWFAKDYPPETIALMAIIGRVGLLLVDLVMGLIFAPFATRR